MTTATISLTDFLLARIAEDEAVATDSTTGPWQAFADGSVTAPEAAGNYEVATGKTWNVSHIARHDPARVLADCEAKRRIVSQCDMIDRGPALGAFSQPEAEHARYMLRCLALPYADHPDFREEWRP